MSRENILKNITKNKPALKDLPQADFSKFKQYDNLVEAFTANATAVGAAVVSIQKEKVKETITEKFPDAKEIISLVSGINLSTIELSPSLQSINLDNLDVAILQAQFGVAENGAV